MSGNLVSEGFLSIQDEKGRTLRYKLNLDESPTAKPLLVVLHGHGSKPTNFRFPGWNVLSPYDEFGLGGKGCWWLGENGDFFVKELLSKLIETVTNDLKCEDKLYFYGSSMGAYGALLQGMACRAQAVYANVPQVRFSQTDYFRVNHKNYESIFGDTKNSHQYLEDDLTRFFAIGTPLPTFFVCESFNNPDQALFRNYAEQHALYFMEACKSVNANLHLELVPQKGHDKIYGLKEVIGKFYRFVINERILRGLKCTVAIREGTIYLMTEAVAGWKYAFHLYFSDHLEQFQYTSNPEVSFDIGRYAPPAKVIFFYQSIDGVKYHKAFNACGHDSCFPSYEESN